MDKLTFTGQLESLEIGESLVKVERLPLEGATAEDITKTVTRVRNGCSQITNRISKKQEQYYQVESLTTLTPDRTGVFCMAVVTRVDGDEIDI